MLDRTRLAELRRRNTVQSVVVLMGMAALLAALGWSVAGWNGVIWGLLGGGLALLLQPRLSWRMLRALYGARPLSIREAPGLYSLVGELARRASLPTVPALFYIPNRIAQAVTVGRGAEAAIGLTDGLLRVLSERELAAVIAHEISHVRHRDLWLLELASAANRLTSLLSTFGLVLVVLYLPVLLVGEVELPLPTMLLLLIAPTVSALLQLRLARTRELDADAGAVELTGDPHGLALALDKLERLQGGLFEGLVRSGQGWLGKLLRTHPDTAERIAHLEALAPAERVPKPLPAELFFGTLGQPTHTHPVWLNWLRKNWY